jgi:large subunit ribosomal protein L10e
MALRKATAYSKKYARPFTRKSRQKRRAYIKTVPNQKVVKLHMGDIKGYEEGKFKTILTITSTEKIQIRDNALEASRQSLHKDLETALPGQYYLELKVFPHHILREHRMLTGAGADRMSTGMSLSFGSTMGRAAFVKVGGPIFLIAVNSDKSASSVRTFIERIKSKLPCRIRVITEKLA